MGGCPTRYGRQQLDEAVALRTSPARRMSGLSERGSTQKATISRALASPTRSPRSLWRHFPSVPLGTLADRPNTSASHALYQECWPPCTRSLPSETVSLG